MGSSSQISTVFRSFTSQPRFAAPGAHPSGLPRRARPAEPAQCCGRRLSRGSHDSVLAVTQMSAGLLRVPGEPHGVELRYRALDQLLVFTDPSERTKCERLEVRVRLRKLRCLVL